MANRDCWDSVAKGEAVKEESMRLPGDSEGADANFRERLVALLHVPPPTTAAFVEGTRVSPIPQTLDVNHTADFSTSTMNITDSGKNVINVTSTNTVGGGGTQ